RIRRRLSRADMAVITANVWPLGNPARRTLYVVQIPYGPLRPSDIVRTACSKGPREALKQLGRRLLLRDARRAEAVIVYSRFVQGVLRRHHGIESHVIYPGVEVPVEGSMAKEKAILGVGRFFRGPYNDKRHDVLVDAFKDLYDSLEDKGWELHLAGGSSDDVVSRTYLEDLRRRAAGYPVGFHVNCPHQELGRLYSKAALFWHAAGYGANEETDPERMEHFGMSTVEAMGHWCVPLVVNGGGLREIVADNVSGCLWDSPADLVRQSHALITSPGALEPLRHEARRRAADFNSDEFRRRLLDAVGLVGSS
ncbi:glycosyltransferase family 4 protein, partial [Candidatus Fermentibacteria bacterium]|nr:glycosyltransferase family 4 protein [Candidatus Fermentibacteria bacterium]